MEKIQAIQIIYTYKHYNTNNRTIQSEFYITEANIYTTRERGNYWEGWRDYNLLGIYLSIYYQSSIGSSIWRMSRRHLHLAGVERVLLLLLPAPSRMASLECGCWWGNPWGFSWSICSQGECRTWDCRCAWALGRILEGNHRWGFLPPLSSSPGPCWAAFSSCIRRSRKIKIYCFYFIRGFLGAYHVHVADVPPWQRSSVYLDEHVEPRLQVVLAGILPVDVCWDGCIAWRAAEVWGLSWST